MFFDGVQPGTYEINLACSGKMPAFTEVPCHSLATLAKEDRLTSGNWGGKYGSGGRSGQLTGALKNGLQIFEAGRKWAKPQAGPVRVVGKKPNGKLMRAGDGRFTCPTIY